MHPAKKQDLITEGNVTDRPLSHPSPIWGQQKTNGLSGRTLRWWTRLRGHNNSPQIWKIEDNQKKKKGRKEMEGKGKERKKKKEEEEEEEKKVSRRK